MKYQLVRGLCCSIRKVLDHLQALFEESSQCDGLPVSRAGPSLLYKYLHSVIYLKSVAVGTLFASGSDSLPLANNVPTSEGVVRRAALVLLGGGFLEIKLPVLYGSE